ncbi:hypothetical protein KO561_14285 [Radiobacillus kanasensis]|nr:hypothetical protein [Radiobacillus kanasensis]UFT98362.1 hypothetical protein KO561_14285 [Radiobacillus kanasensis]
MLNTLIGVMIFFAIFAVFDALKKVNHNILAQTDEIRKLREVLVKQEEH